ncbi:hypothetical protein FKM82_025971 [Ascaphus truei]
MMQLKIVPNAPGSHVCHVITDCAVKRGLGSHRNVPCPCSTTIVKKNALARLLLQCLGLHTHCRSCYPAENPANRDTRSPGQLETQTMKKIGHRRVDSTGETTYKKTTSSALKGAIQLGITHTVGSLSTKPERDVLMQDFYVVESIFFPGEGSNLTPAHHYNDFRFKTYAPVAFRYFRELFGIRPDDYLYSLCNEPLFELFNSGASGSLFYLSGDDEFIIKTVQHKEAEFLQKLLPGYYMVIW